MFEKIFFIKKREELEGINGKYALSMENIHLKKDPKGLLICRLWHLDVPKMRTIQQGLQENRLSKNLA